MHSRCKLEGGCTFVFSLLVFPLRGVIYHPTKAGRDSVHLTSQLWGSIAYEVCMELCC